MYFNYPIGAGTTVQVDQPDEVSEFDSTGANSGGNWNWNQGVGDLFDFVPNLIGSIKGTQPDQVTNVYAPTEAKDKDQQQTGWSGYAMYGIIALIILVVLVAVWMMSK